MKEQPPKHTAPGAHGDREAVALSQAMQQAAAAYTRGEWPDAEQKVSRAVPEYLARYRTTDLFLDTLPYNAGTTASDALWMGVPVLTRMGESLRRELPQVCSTLSDCPSW